tara:strand:+ start:2884 stop:3861 length:978 start_codon:yes stop_codon:yes gene_type:complete
MAYIPKSQIKDNQFTPGAEWYYIKNNSSYTGFYYVLSNGKAYTGKSPQNPPNEEIYQKKKPIMSLQEKDDNAVNDGSNAVEYADNYDGFVFENQTQNAKDVEIYGILTDTDYNLIRSKPQKVSNFPTLEDYIKGFYTRYFVVKINQLEYIEIDKETYDNIETKNGVWVWEDYIPFTLNWHIKGNIDRVFNNNKGVIFIAEKDIKRKGLENYLGKNYLQYYEYEEASNLQTLGDELITPSGVDYVGPYHIHKKQGPMEGVEHISQGHRKLFYKRFYVGQIVNSLNQTGVIETGETQGVEYRTDISIDINYTPPSTENGGSSTGGGY